MTDQTLVQVVLPGVVEPEDLQVQRSQMPQPGPGQIVIAMEATGVSFAEQQMRRGRYYDQPPFPFVPGYDVVGRVHAVGAGVGPDLLGRRVAVLTKVGFHEEGLARQYLRINGQWADHLLFALLRADYDALLRTSR